jgi:hypothetical protein
MVRTKPTYSIETAKFTAFDYFNVDPVLDILCSTVLYYSVLSTKVLLDAQLFGIASGCQG